MKKIQIFEDFDKDLWDQFDNFGFDPKLQLYQKTKSDVAEDPDAEIVFDQDNVLIVKIKKAEKILNYFKTEQPSYRLNENMSRGAQPYVLIDVKNETQADLQNVLIWAHPNGTITAQTNKSSLAPESIQVPDWQSVVKPRPLTELANFSADTLSRYGQNWIKAENYPLAEVEAAIQVNPAIINFLGSGYSDQEIEQLFELLPENFTPSNKAVAVKYKYWKQTPEQKEQWETKDLYIYIGYPKFIEVEVGGETFHKKSMEIERIVKVNPRELTSHGYLSGMSMRARMQNPDAKIYGIWVDKDMLDEDELNDIAQEEGPMKKMIIDKSFVIRV